LAQAGSITKLSQAFARLAKCTARGSAKLRHDLDQAVIALLHQTPIDLEVMEAIFDAAGTTFAKYPTKEPARTALEALGTSENEGARRYALKVDFESLPSASHLRMQTMLSEAAHKTLGVDAVPPLRSLRASHRCEPRRASFAARFRELSWAA
jgi:hypothetical protein